MTINLISERQYNILLGIQAKYPKLTFQNTGYEYVDKSKFSEKDHKAFRIVENILKKNIWGFGKFNNFRITKSKEIDMRFQYNWTKDDPTSGIPYEGVGYVLVEELHKGFRKQQS